MHKIHFPELFFSVTKSHSYSALGLASNDHLMAKMVKKLGSVVLTRSILKLHYVRCGFQASGKSDKVHKLSSAA